MSTAKRPRPRQREPKSATPPPAAKRIKTTKTSHVPARSGLDFLVDEEARNGKRLEAKLTNGTPNTKTSRVDEAHTVVAPDGGDEDQVGSSSRDAVHNSSSEDESSEGGEDEDEGDENGHVTKGKAEVLPVANGHVSDAEDAEKDDQAVDGAEDMDMSDEDGAEQEETSFGDLLQARHPNPIDVQSSFPDPMADRNALVPAGGDRTLTAPSGSSLRTVLTQALKTNDRELLERCFQTTDLNDIRLTIERLSSQYVSVLLQRLAERIYKRPGRTGNLITWVQWSLVAHGAYLASQPEVMKKLRSLSQVLRERASGLQPLLRLKGKLDMLQAQLELRQRFAADSRAAIADDEDDEEGVIYVEGQDEDWTDGEGKGDDDEDVDADADARLLEGSIPMGKKTQTVTPRNDEESSDDDESDDEVPNGVVEDDEDDSEADDEDNLLDIEAEESSDNDAEDSINDKSGADSEEEDASSDGESEPEVKQPKLGTLNRKR